MIKDIDAIAFDIDGTLYPNWGLYRRLGPFLLSSARFLVCFGKVRKEIRIWQETHPGESHRDFFGWQASLMAPYLGLSTAESQKLIDEKIYEGWKPLFTRVKPFPHLDGTFRVMKQAGLKIGLLSDFRPDQKGDIWGLAPQCDVIIGSEVSGALKPSPVPFKALAAALGVKCERILYVGNSVRSDVQGASAVGMKTACIINPIAAFLGFTARGADISFASYRQLTRIVLE